jgi:hypothetical protein
VVPILSRDWALCAIEDLRREGLTAELEGRNALGSWLVRIEGPAGTIAEIRYSLHPRPEPVCWEGFVNDSIRDPSQTAWRPRTPSREAEQGRS